MWTGVRNAALFGALSVMAAACASDATVGDATGAAAGDRQPAPADDDSDGPINPDDTEADGAVDFYAAPDPIDGEPGDLVRSEPIEAPGVPGAVERVLYVSTSVAGDPIVVSGVVARPDGDPPEGGWAVLTYAHGTTGLADECAPSLALDGQETALLTVLLERGWVVAATDYEGLGTPGPHPYIVGESEGRGVLDIVRTAAEVTGGGTSEAYAVWGHSQGGHAALFAGQIAAERLPDRDLVGVVAGAPASELSLMTDVLRGSDFQGYLAMAAAGINAAHPEAALDLVFTDEAIELLAVVDEGCTGAVFDVFNPLAFEDIALVDDPLEVPEWKAAIEANDPGHVTFDAPLLILHGEDDEQIPVAASGLLMDRVCGLGQNAERVTYPGAGHAAAVGAYMEDMLAWLDARYAGEPTAGTCP